MLQTHRNLTWRARPLPSPQEVARRYRRLDVVAAIVGSAAGDAAWAAWLADVPMSWLPRDHFAREVRS